MTVEYLWDNSTLKSNRKVSKKFYKNFLKLLLTHFWVKFIFKILQGELCL